MGKSKSKSNRAGGLPVESADPGIPHAVEHVALSPEEYALSSGEPPHEESLTAVAVEAAAGLPPILGSDEIPGEDALLRGGDPDVDPLNNEFVGEELPGGAMATPDQNDVDAIGRAYGLSEQGDGPLRSAEELLERRDAHRWDAERQEPS